MVSDLFYELVQYSPEGRINYLVFCMELVAQGELFICRKEVPWVGVRTGCIVGGWDTVERLTRDFFQCVFSDSSALLFFVVFFFPKVSLLLCIWSTELNDFGDSCEMGQLFKSYPEAFSLDTWKKLVTTPLEATYGKLKI